MKCMPTHKTLIMDPAIIGLIASAISAIGGYASSKKKSKVDPNLVSAGQQVLDTASQYFMNRASQNNAMDAQMKLANVQNRMQQAFWMNSFNAQNARQDYLNRNAAVIQRNALRAAGLNGASMDNGTFVTSANTGAIGASMPSFSPIALDVGAARSMSLQNQKQAAEVELLREQTAGQRETNKILSSDAAFRDAINLGQVDLQYSNIQLNNWKTNATEEEVKVYRNTARKLEQESKNLLEQLNILKENYKQEQIRSKLLEPHIKAQISNLISGTALNYETVQKFLLEELNIKEEGYNLRIIGNKLGIEANTMEDLYELEKVSGILGQIAKIVIPLLAK